MRMLVLCTALLLACGGSPAPTTTVVATPVSLPAQPAPPSAYDYLTEQSLGFVRVDMVQLRESELWAFVPLAVGFMFPEGVQQPLLEMTEKIDVLTLGFLPEDDGSTDFGVMVLDGSLTLDEIAAAFDENQQPYERPEMNGLPTVRQGSFVVAEASPERLIVTNGLNEDHLHGPLPSSGIQNAHAPLLARMPAEPTLLFLTQDDPTIDAETMAIGFDARDGLQVRGAWQFSDPARADQHAQEIRTTLASPPPMPPEMAEVRALFERVEVVSEAGQLAVSIDLSADEVTRLLPLVQSFAMSNFQGSADATLPTPTP